MSVFDSPPDRRNTPAAPRGVEKTWGGRAFSRPRCLDAVVLLSLALALPGCAVVTVAGAAAGAAISVAGAVVSTGIKVTGKVIEKTVDVIVPDGKGEEP